MLNIIEHLWQFQAKNIEILSTVILSNKNKPNFYFYSDKKNRILRKKNNQVQDICQYLEEQISLKNQLMILRFSCKKKINQKKYIIQKHNNSEDSFKTSSWVQINLASYNDVSTFLRQNHQSQQKYKNFQEAFVILPSQCLNNILGQQQSTVMPFFYDFYNFKVLINKKRNTEKTDKINFEKTNIINIEIERQKSFTQKKSVNKQKIIQQKQRKMICVAIQKWMKQIEHQANKWFNSQYSNNEEVRVAQFEGLLMTKHQKSLIINLKLIWCFKFSLQFKHSNMQKIYSNSSCQIFNFEYLLLQCKSQNQKNRDFSYMDAKVKKTSFVKKQPNCNNEFKIQHQLLIKEQNYGKTQVFNTNTEIKCWGCEQICMQKQYKEVSNEDIIALRRSNKLPIRGISQEYYKICPICYQNLNFL